VNVSQRLFRNITSRTPIIIQTEAAECGLACLAMVAGHHGHRLDLAAIRRRFSVSLKGLTLRDLVGVGAKLKMATRALRLDLQHLTQLKLPCILHWDHNHFVVLTKVGSNHITIHDPAVGQRKITMEEVSKHFTGVALEAWPTKDFERKNERDRIRILSLLRRTSGIGRAAAKVLAVSVLLEVVAITTPIGFQLVVDEVIITNDYDLLTLIALSLVVLMVLQSLATMLRSWITLLVGSSIMVQWSTSLFDHLMRLPLHFFEKRHVGDVVSRFGSLNAIRESITTSAVVAVLDGVMSIALIAVMWIYGGALLFVPVGALVLYTILRLIAYQRYRAYSEEEIVYAAQENSHFIETVRGIASMKALNLEARRRETWLNHVIDRISADIKQQKFDILFSSASQGILGLSRILVIYLGVRMAFSGQMSIGMLLAFLAYNDQFTSRINSLVNTMLQFRILSLHSERVADIALAEPEEPARDGGVAHIAAQGQERNPARIVVENVHYRYADNEPDVLANVNLAIEPGECVGIAGPFGSGKTTLLKILSGLAVPTEGRVVIDGTPVPSLGLDAYRSRVACVLQDDRLFAGSIADNISAFDPTPDPAWIQQCAMMAQIHYEIAQMPIGYDTLVGDMGSTLSGGQMQRVVLARALYRRPSILFLDEATSHLDERNETAINIAIKRLSITRVIVAHRASTLAMTDRVVQLGSIQESKIAAFPQFARPAGDPPKEPEAPPAAPAPSSAPAPAAPSYGYSQSSTWVAKAQPAAEAS
jgi:ATP-binding cassette subfamily B protein RaxB